MLDIREMFCYVNNEWLLLCSFTAMFQLFICLQTILDILHCISSNASAPCPQLLRSQFVCPVYESTASTHTHTQGKLGP
jgi:hypothetical protein